MIRVADENEAEEEVPPFTTPPSPAPPPPPIAPPLPTLRSPPPTVPAAMVGLGTRRASTPAASPAPSASDEEDDPPKGDAAASSPRQALPRPPPVSPIGVVGLTPRETPRRPSSPSTAPSPSAFEEEDGTLKEVFAAAPCRQAEAGLRNPVLIRDAVATSAPTDKLCASRSAPQLLKLAAHTHTGGDVAVGGREDGTNAAAAAMQAANIFWQWAATRDPHLLQYAQPAHADTASTDDIAVEDQKEVVEQCAVRGPSAVRDEYTVEEKEKVWQQQGAVGGKGENNTAPKGQDKAVEQCDTYELGTAENGDAEDDQETVEQFVAYLQLLGYKMVDPSVIGEMPASTDDIAEDASVTFSDATEPIQITNTENVDIEMIGYELTSMNICGKMVVQFPPELDGRVQFLVKRCGQIELTVYPRADRELAKTFNIIRSNDSNGFSGSFDLLKWHKNNAPFPLPLLASPEFYQPVQGLHKSPENLYFVGVVLGPTGKTNIHNVVVTIPIPQVDRTGEAKKIRTHVWTSSGTHSELENTIIWQIPHIGGSDNRKTILDLDVYCHGGCMDRSQFFPVKVEFFYETSIGSNVAAVLKSLDGHEVDFVQTTMAHGSYIMHDATELTRRATEAADAEAAWQVGAWEGEDDDW